MIEHNTDGKETPASRVRARTISIKRLSKREIRRGQEEMEREYRGLPVLPQTREACLQGENTERPCPFVSCKFHLYLDVNERKGSIKLNFPDREVWEMNDSCALDIADRGGAILDEVAAAMNFTRERARQVELRACGKVLLYPGVRDVLDVSVLDGAVTHGAPPGTPDPPSPIEMGRVLSR